jgi:hypothetical protein
MRNDVTHLYDTFEAYNNFIKEVNYCKKLTSDMLEKASKINKTYYMVITAYAHTYRDMYILAGVYKEANSAKNYKNIAALEAMLNRFTS